VAGDRVGRDRAEDPEQQDDRAGDERLLADEALQELPAQVRRALADADRAGRLDWDRFYAHSTPR